jgi:hypothetical protein
MMSRFTIVLGVVCGWTAGVSQAQQSELIPASQYFPVKRFQAQCPIESIEVGDVNGDGYLDILMQDSDCNGYSLMISAGDGASGRLNRGGGGDACTMVDSDGDGAFDQIASVRYDDEQSWLRLADPVGAGGGMSTVTEIEFPLESVNSVNDIIARDLDGDGDDDLVLLSRSTLLTFINDGDGAGFLDPVILPLGILTVSDHFAIDDIDGDGDPEAMIAQNDEILVLEYQGAGAWLEGTSLFFDSNANSFQFGDLDNDGDLDLLRYWGITGGQAMLNDGSGNFGAPFSLGINAPGGDWMTLIDFNSDGVLDILNSYHELPTVWLGLGDGSFAAQVSFGSIGLSGLVAGGDMDNDGDMDIVVAGGAHQGNRTIAIYENDSNSGLIRFTNAADWDIRRGFFSPLSVWFDADQDGDTDTVSFVLSSDSDTFELLVATNDGSGAYSVGTPIPYDIDGFSSDSVAGALSTDLDQDGDHDLVFYGSELHTWFNDGTGGFTSGSAVLLPSEALRARSADMNGDGSMDLVLQSEESLIVFANNGAGVFTSVTYAMFEGQGSVLEVGDLDGDGDQDILTSLGNRFSWELVMLYNLVSGVVFQPDDFETGDSPKAGALFDMDFDGDLDVVLVRESGRIGSYRNEGARQFSHVVNTNVGSNQDDLSIYDVDGDGVSDVVSNDGDSVSVLLSEGNGTFCEVTSYGAALRLSGSRSHIGDLNGDGFVDVGVTDHMGISIFEGREDTAPSAMDCPVDLNCDQRLDFFDLSMLLQQSIDFNGDTTFDFFDISSYLTAYQAGCP